jgi:hypothetical protein
VKSSALLPPTWLTVLAWIFLMACGFRVLADLAQGTFGYDPLVVRVGIGNVDPVELPAWWAVIHIAVEVSFGIGCGAVLFRDRDLVWFAIVGGWAVAVLQCCDAFIGIFHLRFAIPVSALVYAAMAWRAASLLDAERPAPPHTLGTI